MEEKIQIVAFSTNKEHNNPNDIINIYLEQNNHLILKKNKNAIAFSTTISNSQKNKKIMVCSVLNLEREYTGITDVNCYLIFIDLENEESKNKFESIISYFKDYCDLGKKTFVFGMVEGNEKKNIVFDKNDFSKSLDNLDITYDYKEINFSNKKQISDYMKEVFIYSSKHSFSGSTVDDKEADQSGSCKIF